jgi:hypothetical protein
MARTETIKLVAGGKAPRKNLHELAARRRKPSKHGQIRRPKRLKPGSKSDLLLLKILNC